MRVHQYASKEKTVQIPTQTLTSTPNKQSLILQQQPEQLKSNAEGLAEHVERLKKFQHVGSSLEQMGPPRFENSNPTFFQPKLTLGQPGDKYELEADKVAKQVVNQLDSPAIRRDISHSEIQRQDQGHEDETLAHTIQRLNHIAAYEPTTQPLLQRRQDDTPNLEQSIQQLRGKGKPLDDQVRTSMERVFGTNFNGVRVHNNGQADQLSRSIQAKAFTTGKDIFFRQDAYQPTSRSGQELIAHELTHVLQQNPRSTQPPTIQRELDTDKVERYKGILELKAVSIVEMPKGGAKATDPLSKYPDENLYNVPSNLQDKSLFNLSTQMTKEEADSKYGADFYKYYQTVTAYSFLQESQGGGAFISPFKLAVICEGAPDRALLHEMGHAEQQERLGAQFGGSGTTVNQIILEYHNVLLNENQYDLVDTDKSYEDLDIRTSYNKSNLGKHKDKTWDNLYTDACNEHPLNKSLLDEIRYLLDQEIFNPWASETEKNLISEYYVNVS